MVIRKKPSIYSDVYLSRDLSRIRDREAALDIAVDPDNLPLASPCHVFMLNDGPLEHVTPRRVPLSDQGRRTVKVAPRV